MKPIGPMRSIKTVGDIRRLSPEQLQQLQYQRLHKLVDYARRNSPYWQELLQDLPEGFTLADLPITRKGDLAQQFERCITCLLYTSAQEPAPSLRPAHRCGSRPHWAVPEAWGRTR